MKYIITKETTDKPSLPYIFSEYIDHLTVAKKVCGDKDQVHSAGFCSPTVMNNNTSILRWKCFGDSVSLDLKSNGLEDEDILNTFLNCN